MRSAPKFNHNFCVRICYKFCKHVSNNFWDILLTKLDCTQRHTDKQTDATEYIISCRSTTAKNCRRTTQYRLLNTWCCNRLLITEQSLLLCWISLKKFAMFCMDELIVRIWLDGILPASDSHMLFGSSFHLFLLYDVVCGRPSFWAHANIVSYPMLETILIKWFINHDLNYFLRLTIFI